MHVGLVASMEAWLPATCGCAVKRTAQHARCGTRQLYSVATSCIVLQRAAQCCNELHSVATCAIGPEPAPRCSTARLARTTAATRQTADFARAAPIIAVATLPRVSCCNLAAQHGALRAHAPRAMRPAHCAAPLRRTSAESVASFLSCSVRT